MPSCAICRSSFEGGGNSSVANDWFRAQTAQVRSWQLERMSNGGGLEVPSVGTLMASEGNTSMFLLILLYLSLITCPMKRLRRYCRFYTVSNAVGLNYT